MLITQYDAHGVGREWPAQDGFLGLRNLTFAQKMQELLYGNSKVVSLRIEDIDLEDKATLALFAAGRPRESFSLKQPGAIRLLKRVKPQNFEEVVATTSFEPTRCERLYR